MRFLRRCHAPLVSSANTHFCYVRIVLLVALQPEVPARMSGSYNEVFALVHLLNSITLHASRCVMTDKHRKPVFLQV
jgi:hypothetical protein